MELCPVTVTDRAQLVRTAKNLGDSAIANRSTSRAGRAIAAEWGTTDFQIAEVMIKTFCH